MAKFNTFYFYFKCKNICFLNSCYLPKKKKKDTNIAFKATTN